MSFAKTIVSGIVVKIKSSSRNISRSNGSCFLSKNQFNGAKAIIPCINNCILKRHYAQLSQSHLLYASLNPHCSPLEPKISQKKPNSTNGNPSKSNSNSNLVSKLLNLPTETYENPVLAQEHGATKWRTVYRLPSIRVARVVQRMKLYQTAFTCCVAMPATFGLYISGVADQSLVVFTSLTCGLACAMLYVMGNFASRLIGVIYVAEHDDSVVRVAHLTFFGNRKDEIFKKTDFVPFSELPDNLKEAYIHIKTYSDPENKLYLSLKYGQIHDFTQFQEIFGHSEFIVKEITKSQLKK